MVLSLESPSKTMHIYSVVQDAVPAAMTARHIEQESAEDPLLIQVRYAIREDKWADLEHTVFKSVREELWVIGQIVMKGSRIVLPQKMQRRTLILAHEGHQGVVRTKARLRKKVWWARMDKYVEAFVRECDACQLVGARSKPELIRSTPLPQGPWEEIAIYICGPLPNGESLLHLQVARSGLDAKYHYSKHHQMFGDHVCCHAACGATVGRNLLLFNSKDSSSI